MAVIGLTADGRKIVLATESPTTYSTGGVSVTVDEVNRIDAVIHASIDGGYFTNVSLCSVSGNTVTVPVYRFNYGAASPGPAVEVPDGTDLSGTTITLIVIGT